MYWNVSICFKYVSTSFQNTSLGLFRSDYFFCSDNQMVKQVEFNTIASSCGTTATKLIEAHKWVFNTCYISYQVMQEFISKHPSNSRYILCELHHGAIIDNVSDLDIESSFTTEFSNFLLDSIQWSFWGIGWRNSWSMEDIWFQISSHHVHSRRYHRADRWHLWSKIYWIWNSATKSRCLCCSEIIGRSS